MIEIDYREQARFSQHRCRRRLPSSADEATARSRQADIRDGQPRYLQIARELKRASRAARTPVGARLPTELELCEQFGISRFTARAAVRVLASAGLVTRRQRVGTVVIATARRRALHPRCGVVARPAAVRAGHRAAAAVHRQGRRSSKTQAREFGVKAGRRMDLCDRDAPRREEQRQRRPAVLRHAAVPEPRAKGHRRRDCASARARSMR